MTFPDCENTNEQLYSFPQLPEDLYTRDCQSNQFDVDSSKHTRSIRRSSQTLAEYEVYEHHPQPDVQHRAAIAAFRPEEILAASTHQGNWHQRRFQPAPADSGSFPSDDDVRCFAAAMSAHAEGLKGQQQAHDLVALPFPGMHTLDLTFPFTQPALWEAAQQLLERPRDFQAVMTRCPLSQVSHRCSTPSCSVGLTSPLALGRDFLLVS